MKLDGQANEISHSKCTQNFFIKSGVINGNHYSFDRRVAFYRIRGYMFVRSPGFFEIGFYLCFFVL